jgi:hypothetical protein
MRRMSADKTLKWTTSTLLGFAEMSRARSEEAACFWLHAAGMLQGAAADPLLAASLSNAGIASLILQQQHDADRVFHEAEQAWRRVADNFATLDMPMVGASSSFHFRLAAKAPDALIDARRQRFLRLAEAALAITRFNHLFVDIQNVSSGVVAQRADELKAMLCDVLGAGSIEVRLLSTAAGQTDTASLFAIYRDKATEFAARQGTLSTALSQECAELETAVALTALLWPRIFAVIKNEKTKTATGFDTAPA